MDYLETYQRLDRPPLCPKTFHDLMTWCWELGYQLRPSFTEIKEELKTFLTSQQDSKIISNQNFPNQEISGENHSKQKDSDQRDSGFEHYEQNPTDGDYIDVKNLTRIGGLHQESDKITMESNPSYVCATCYKTALFCKCTGYKI